MVFYDISYNIMWYNVILYDGILRYCTILNNIMWYNMISYDVKWYNKRIFAHNYTNLHQSHLNSHYNRRLQKKPADINKMNLYI